MPLPQRYNRLLRRHTLHFAAWSPITDPQKLGDYGLLDRGVFRKLGNIAEFGVDFSTESGNAAAWDFTSTVKTQVRIQAGVQVPIFDDSNIEARLKIEFDGQFAALVKSPEVRVEAMQSIHAVAKRLQAAGGWKPRFRVISKVYTAEQPLIVASLGNSTVIELSGTAKVLRKLELGEATIGVSVIGEHQLKLVGNSGAIAIDLFRVRQSNAIPLMLGAAGSEELSEPDDIVDGSENWSSDVDDLGEP
jgi:hypothetical protein